MRLLGLLAVIAIAASCVLFLLTREARYLRFAYRLTRYTVVAALAVFGLLLVERLAVLV